MTKRRSRHRAHVPAIQDLAIHHAATAIAAYERNGSAPPLVALHGRSFDLVGFLAEGDPRETAPVMAMHLCWLAEPWAVVFLSEAFRAPVTEGEAMPEHGELAARSEHDPDIQTAIIVYAFSNTEECSALANPTMDDDGRVAWVVEIRPGPSAPGVIPERMRAAIQLGAGLRVAHPFSESPSEAAKMIGRHIGGSVVMQQAGSLLRGPGTPS